MFHATLDWILANPFEVGVLIAIVLAAIQTGRATGSLREGLLALMLQASQARRQGRLGAVDGPQVMDWVIRQAMLYVVPFAPIWIRPLLTEKRLRQLAQNLYDKATDWIDDGQFNGSHKPPVDSSSTVEVAAAAGRPSKRPGGRHL